MVLDFIFFGEIKMYEENKHPVRDIVAMGTGVFTALFLLAFYPATVMMAYFGSMTEPGGMQKGFFAFAITWIIIAVLTVTAKNPNVDEGYRAWCWIALVLIYICCLPGLFHILDNIYNPVYESDRIDAKPLPYDIHLLPYDGFWKDFFTPSLAQIWAVTKIPLLVVIVVLPLRLIFGFGKKNKE